MSCYALCRLRCLTKCSITQIRVYAMGNSENTTYWGKSIPRLEDYGTEEHLNIKSVKLFTDGTPILSFFPHMLTRFAYA